MSGTLLESPTLVSALEGSFSNDLRGVEGRDFNSKASRRELRLSIRESNLAKLAALVFSIFAKAAAKSKSWETLIIDDNIKYRVEI